MTSFATGTARTNPCSSTISCAWITASSRFFGAELVPDDDLLFFFRRGIIHADANQETIELRFRQRIGSLELDRILRRQDEERPIQRIAFAPNRDLPFLHRLEQCRLGLRRRSVDFVREDEVREKRPLHEAARAPAGGGIFLDDLRAGDPPAARSGVEMDAVIRQVQRPGQRRGHERFSDARHPEEQRVAIAQKADEHQLALGNAHSRRWRC